MNEPPVRLAIVGCGAIARRHLGQILTQPERLTVTRLYDFDPAQSARLAQEFALGDVAVASLEEALDPAAVDGVLIGSPTQVHYSQARAAILRGLDVLCEKPLALRREEIVDLANLARERGRILSVGYQRRYEAPYVTARRELAQTDRYGKVREIHLFVCEHWAQTIPGTWRDDPAVGSGYFGDAGTHQVDIAGYIAGSYPEAVLAWSEPRNSRVHVATRAFVRWHGGAGGVAHFVGDAHEWREVLRFHAEHADLVLQEGKMYRCAENRIEPIERMEPEETPTGAFARAIRSRQATVSPAECALGIFDWTQAVLRSAETQTWTTVGPG